MATSNQFEKDPQLAAYVAHLLEQRNIAAMELTEDEIAGLQDDLYMDVDTFLKEQIVGSLTEEQALVFADIVQQGDHEQIQNYITTALPEIDTIVSEALMEFQTHYLRS